MGKTLFLGKAVGQSVAGVVQKAACASETTQPTRTPPGGQIVSVVLKYVRDNPADAYHTTAALILVSLGKVYPCLSK